MSENFGDVELPLPEDDEGDPALATIGSYFSSVLTHYCGAKWARVMPGEGRSVPTDGEPEASAPAEGPFSRVITRDPNLDNAYILSDLPAIFVWRGDSKVQKDAVGVFTDRGVINIAWVLPPVQTEKVFYRRSHLNSVVKAFGIAVGRARHPSWILQGDTRVDALEYGSDVLGRSGLDSWMIPETESIERQSVDIEIEGAKKMTADAITFSLHTVEVMTNGDDEDLGYDDTLGTYPTQLDITVLNKDDPEDPITMGEATINTP